MRRAGQFKVGERGNLIHANFTAPPLAFRCTGTVTLRDGTTAQCMHRRSYGMDRCWQHASPIDKPSIAARQAKRRQSRAKKDADKIINVMIDEMSSYVERLADCTNYSVSDITNALWGLLYQFTEPKEMEKP